MKIQESERIDDCQPSSFFCKMQKNDRVGGKNLRLYTNFSTIDSPAINYRRDRSNFKGRYKLKIDLSI